MGETSVVKEWKEMYGYKELADHLTFIIEEEKKYGIPSKPLYSIPQRVNLPILGTQTSKVASFD